MSCRCRTDFARTSAGAGQPSKSHAVTLLAHTLITAASAVIAVAQQLSSTAQSNGGRQRRAALTSLDGARNTIVAACCLQLYKCTATVLAHGIGPCIPRSTQQDTHLPPASSPATHLPPGDELRRQRSHRSIRQQPHTLQCWRVPWVGNQARQDIFLASDIICTLHLRISWACSSIPSWQLCLKR